MKTKLVILIAALFATVSMFFSCAKKEGVAKKSDGSEGGAISVVGPENGTKMEMWTFVDVHAQFYAAMLEKWNEANPDRQIQIRFTNYPDADLRSKLFMAIQTGKGAPDLCDIEITQFPNFLKGVVPFVAMNEYVEPYKKDIVNARLDIYSKDGNYYGIPTHVGATVMYYNDEVLSKYGIDFRQIKTWDDFEKTGLLLKEASGGTVFMTCVDTSGHDWMWVSMAECGEDWTDVGGRADVRLESVRKMIKMQQKWLELGIAKVCAGGQIDTEEGFGVVSSDTVAAFPKAMWYMSRFLNYMPDLAGKFAIAPCPVFEEGQPRSVGIGGTGTVVSNQSQNADLAAQFIAWAKLSYEGNVLIWETLGFDPCNTSIWADSQITQDSSNKYIAYFRTNPFDTLNEIKDEIGKIGITSISPIINDLFDVTVLVNCLEHNADVDEELENAQSEIDLEQ